MLCRTVPLFEVLNNIRKGAKQINLHSNWSRDGPMKSAGCVYVTKLNDVLPRVDKI